MQTVIDFTNRRENNSASQLILDSNKDHINNQCDKVLELLHSGVRLTVRDAIINYGISSLPRRILDLKQKLKIEIKSELVNGRFKVWYL